MKAWISAHIPPPQAMKFTCWPRGFKDYTQVDKAHSHGARASQGSAQGWTPLVARRGSHLWWGNALLVGDRPNKLLEPLKA